MVTSAPSRRLTGQPDIFTILRVILGLIILWRSITFIRDTAITKAVIEETGIGAFLQNSEVIAFVITYLGLLCGLFITVGLFTKVAAIIQIPVLIVAVFFVNIRNIGENLFEFILSMITLILLILFAWKGSGPLSADEYFRRGAQYDKRLSD